MFVLVHASVCSLATEWLKCRVACHVRTCSRCSYIRTCVHEHTSSRSASLLTRVLMPSFPALMTRFSACASLVAPIHGCASYRYDFGCGCGIHCGHRDVHAETGGGIGEIQLTEREKGVHIRTCAYHRAAHTSPHSMHMCTSTRTLSIAHCFVFVTNTVAYLIWNMSSVTMADSATVRASVQKKRHTGCV